MRIVALSDQHGFLPDIPPCDLLIVAGDVCPDRFGPFMAMHDPYQQKAWFDHTARPWLASATATHKLMTWGNHDWCGQACSFRSDSREHASSTDLQIVVDEGTTIPLSAGGHVSVWATPWSNKFLRWAFMKEPRDLEPFYAAIPVAPTSWCRTSHPTGMETALSISTQVKCGTSAVASCSRRLRGFGRSS